MRTITIEVFAKESGNYTVKIDDGPEDGCASVPDEALGYAIRELWLAGTFDDKFVKLNIILPEN